MDRSTFLVMVVVNSLIIQSYSHPRRINKVHLRFRYFELNPNKPLVYDVSGQLVPIDQPTEAYILSGNVTDRTVLSILTITCKKSSNADSKSCVDGNRRMHLILPDLLRMAIKIDGSHHDLPGHFQKFLSQRLHIPPKPATLICTVQYEYDDSRDFGAFQLSKTGLFGVIFLSTCVIVTLLVCTGWIVVSYYRHIAYRRRKKTLRKALECSVQQILDQSPVIIFDSKNNQNPNLDDDPTCAICLETFSDNEKLRKLECSHYYHTICIDPWLLTHHSCPLCNRNILSNAVPSVSAHVTTRENDQLDSYSEADFVYS